MGAVKVSKPGMSLRKENEVDIKVSMIKVRQGFFISRLAAEAWGKEVERLVMEAQEGRE